MRVRFTLGPTKSIVWKVPLKWLPFNSITPRLPTEMSSPFGPPIGAALPAGWLTTAYVTFLSFYFHPASQPCCDIGILIFFLRPAQSPIFFVFLLFQEVFTCRFPPFLLTWTARRPRVILSASHQLASNMTFPICAGPSDP